MVSAVGTGRRASDGVAEGVCWQSGKKESVIDLSKYIDQRVRVKLLGGREGAARQATSSACFRLFVFWCSYWDTPWLRPTGQLGTR